MLAVFGTEGAKGGVWIIETENGREVAILRDNHSPVWSDNSRLLATAVAGSIRYQGGTRSSGITLKGGFQTGDTFLNLGGDSYQIFAQPVAFAISPDGKFLVMACELLGRHSSGGTAGSGEGVLELWDLATRKRLATWNRENFRDFTSCVSFSPDGERVATCSYSGVVIRDAATGKALRTLSQPGTASTVVFSADSKLIFSASRFPTTDSGTIVVNDVETGREIGIWRGHQGPVTALAVDPEGFYLASGGEDRTICLWEVPARDELNRRVFPTSGHQLNRWEAHKTTVTALAFAPVWGSTLATGGADGTLKLWNILSINRELESLGLSSRRSLPPLTGIVLAMTFVGYLVLIIGLLIMRSRPAFKPLPPIMVVIMGGSIMLTGMLFANVLPGVFTWWDYSTPTYFQRLLYLILGGLLFYLLFVKALNWLSFMKRKRSQSRT